MIDELVYFFACIGLGVLSFGVYALMRLLAKKTNLIPVTVILDFLWCGVTFAAFLTLNVYLKDGQPYIYAFCGTIGGYFLGMLMLSIVPVRGKTKEKQGKNKKENTDNKAVADVE